MKIFALATCPTHAPSANSLSLRSITEADSFAATRRATLGRPSQAAWCGCTSKAAAGMSETLEAGGGTTRGFWDRNCPRFRDCQNLRLNALRFNSVPENKKKPLRSGVRRGASVGTNLARRLECLSSTFPNSNTLAWVQQDQKKPRRGARGLEKHRQSAGRCRNQRHNLGIWGIATPQWLR